MEMETTFSSVHVTLESGVPFAHGPKMLTHLGCFFSSWLYQVKERMQNTCNINKKKSISCNADYHAWDPLNYGSRKSHIKCMAQKYSRVQKIQRKAIQVALLLNTNTKCLLVQDFSLNTLIWHRPLPSMLMLLML